MTDLEEIKRYKLGLQYACSKIAMRDKTCPSIKKDHVKAACALCSRDDELIAKCWYDFYEALGTHDFTKEQPDEQ